MTTSVALCTFNGERFIREQFESIINQSLKVDEIVVCDDGSEDHTLPIIKEIANTSNLRIQIYTTENNLGPAKNFQRAISMCSGDLIFLSDQDDIWHPDKVAVIVDWFATHPKINVLFSDAELIDENGKKIGSQSLWDSVGFSPKARVAFNNGYGVELLSYENRATGATMAIRREFAMRSRFLNYCDDMILHDGALAMLSLCDHSLGFLDQKLTSYRCHTGQIVGIGASISTPISDDSRECGPLSLMWLRHNLPHSLKERISFIACRLQHQNQPLGFARMTMKIRSGYKKYYHTDWLSYYSKDISLWWFAMLRRFRPGHE